MERKRTVLDPKAVASFANRMGFQVEFYRRFRKLVDADGVVHSDEEGRPPIEGSMESWEDRAAALSNMMNAWFEEPGAWVSGDYDHAGGGPPRFVFAVESEWGGWRPRTDAYHTDRIVEDLSKLHGSRASLAILVHREPEKLGGQMQLSRVFEAAHAAHAHPSVSIGIKSWAWQKRLDCSQLEFRWLR